MTDMDRAVEKAKAGVMPFESWTRLSGETGLAYSAFCAYRDLGPERTIREAVEVGEKDRSLWDRRYKVWRNWCGTHKWRERAAEYDRYMESLKQAELRKTIEAQGELHRETTRKMLTLVGKKLDMTDPAELTQGTVNEWVQTAVKADREGAELIVPANRGGTGQGELPFGPDFNGI